MPRPWPYQRTRKSEPLLFGVCSLGFLWNLKFELWSLASMKLPAEIQHPKRIGTGIPEAHSEFA
jgi:hypothetical protein